MTNFKKTNNIVGWVVCIIACIVYLLTKEKSASFWDCGEFLSGSYKLEVVHSPGAPLFLLIGRMFTMFTDGKHAAAAVNTLNALCSGFTILFLFWSITHFAKRIFENLGWEITGGNLVAVMASGVVGGLAYTFSDTFWFSAVEGEVYAMSSFLTALVFWAILKWEDQLRDKESINAQKYADRWIIFIFYIMGLSIGVHLLNLLVIPAIIMVYYFNRYSVSARGTAIAFLVGCVVTGFVQYAVIQLIPIMASKFDITFVNTFGLPFNSGVLTFFILLVAGLIFLIRYAKKQGHYKLHLSVLSVLFIIIGYSSYLQIVIRSNADVPIDMTNPDNAIGLVKYLQREQYGNTPLVTGPDYTCRPVGMKEGSMDYAKGKDKYIELGIKQDEYEFDASDKMLFPRIWDLNDPRHVSYYQSYLGKEEGEKPTFGDNIKFFINYQMIQMYWRYFLWNYVGRQNEIQNIAGESDGGNWMSGISFVDRMFGRGDSDKLPEGVRDSRARNHLYGLPFILGLLGLFLQFKNDKRNAFVIFLLFFFTGAAIVIYLNNTPLQPRERDYAYVGSMYAFALWIGLGVLQIYTWLKGKMGDMASAGIAGVVSLVAVPLLMASQEWDDHDRSNKTLPPASATNFLASCEKNAILFTEGDNDTYPLWYLQEIEEYRPDIRIINISLLGIDWYIDQLRYKVNEADAIPMRWTPEMYLGKERNYIQYAKNPNIAEEQAVGLADLLDFINSNDAKAKINTQGGGSVNYLPSLNSYLKNGDSVLPFKLPGEVLYKNDLAILNIVSENFGKRPIYFANTIDPKHYEGLYRYLKQEGFIYRLTASDSKIDQVGAPVPVDLDKSIDLFMNKFKFGGAERNDVFYDQTNKRMLNIVRTAATRIASAAVDAGRKEDAMKVLKHCEKNISEKSYPYGLGDEDRGNIYTVDAYLRAGDTKKAEYIADKLIQYVKDNLNYSNTVGEDDKQRILGEVQNGVQTLSYIPRLAAQAGDTVFARKIEDKLKSIGGNAPVAPAIK
jgi:hypothetical protein